MKFMDFLLVENMDRDAFINAILSNHIDDLHHLIFADYLDERGDPLNLLVRYAAERKYGLFQQEFEKHKANLEREHWYFRKAAPILAHVKPDDNNPINLDTNVNNFTIIKGYNLRGTTLYLFNNTSSRIITNASQIASPLAKNGIIMLYARQIAETDDANHLIDNYLDKIVKNLDFVSGSSPENFEQFDFNINYIERSIRDLKLIKQNQKINDNYKRVISQLADKILNNLKNSNSPPVRRAETGLNIIKQLVA